MVLLHIVFVILKIIGILLLILLGIFFLAALTLLFCPVRYQALGYRDEEKYNGKAGVSWLFHLIFFTAWYDSRGKKSGYEIRILGIPVLKFFKAIKKKKRRRKRRKNISIPSAEVYHQEEPEEGKAGESENFQKIEKKMDPGQERTSIGENPDVDKRKIRVFLRRIKSIFLIPGKIVKALKNFRLTAEGICDKIRKIKKFLENEKFKRGTSLILQEGKKIFIHVLPKKIEGAIKFGTDDPCLTGEILGAAGIFYPLYGENLSIEPCFDQRVLEGTIVLKGRIYGIFVLLSALKIFRSRDVRYIIRHFRQ